MPDRKIKRQRHPDRTRENSLPTTICAHLRQSGQSVVLFVPYCLCGYRSIMQNKPNFKMGKIDTSTATLKSYANKHRTMSNERYQKQTQSNPIPPSLMPSPTRIAASRPIESRHFCRYQLKTLEICVFSPKTQERAVLRGFMGRPEDIAQRRGTFFGSFAAGGMFPIL